MPSKSARAAEAAPPPPTIDDLSARLSTEIGGLERELGEIDMLVAQATAEAGRHEQKRSQAADKLTALGTVQAPDASAQRDLAVQLLNLTKRAAIMQTQVEVLEGKRKVLDRYRDSLERLAEELKGPGITRTEQHLSEDPGDGGMPPAVSRIVLAAQEELRREIARAMHDGPAQSLTNIVLQAQIVERLLTKNPEAARGEVGELVAMVQQTLDATKSFIFDVRPMVLDDLGLVPTLRRATRDRGRRAGIDVEFESFGTDRRLPMELESGLFRILDEALTGYLAAAPQRIRLRLEWGEQLDARMTAYNDDGASPRAGTAGTDEPTSKAQSPSGEDLPPALAAMMEDRRTDRLATVESQRVAAIAALPAAAWREIRHRAATIGAAIELLAEGAELRVVLDLPAVGESTG